MFRFLMVVMILVFTVSCKSSFRISVVNPASVKLPEEVTKIGVINNSQRPQNLESAIGNVLSGQQTGNRVANENAVIGVSRALDASNRLQNEIIEQPEELKLASGEINWEYLDQLALEKQIGAIIEFTEIRTTNPLTSAAVATTTGRRNRRIEGNLMVNYYIIPTRELHEQYRVRRFYTIRLHNNQSIEFIMSDIRRFQEYYRMLGYNLGYGAGSLVYNHWVWVNRKFYNKGSYNLRKSKRMIKAGNWNIAEQQLMQDVEHTSRKVRGRTLYNLALVMEGQGNLDAAIDFAEKAAVQLGNKLTNEYLRTLRRRKELLANL